MLKSRMNGNKVMYVDELDHQIKLRLPKNEECEYWFYEHQTQTIRSFENWNLTLSFEGSKVSLQEFNGQATPAQKQEYEKETYHLKTNNTCLDNAGGVEKNVDGNLVSVAACDKASLS